MTRNVKASWAATVALASGSALAVAIASIAGFRSGRGDEDALVRELQLRQSKIDQLSADLDKARADRDRLDAELHAAKGAPASRPTHGRRGSE